MDDGARGPSYEFPVLEEDRFETEKVVCDWAVVAGSWAGRAWEAVGQLSGRRWFNWVKSARPAPTVAPEKLAECRWQASS